MSRRILVWQSPARRPVDVAGSMQLTLTSLLQPSGRGFRGSAIGLLAEIAARSSHHDAHSPKDCPLELPSPSGHDGIIGRLSLLFFLAVTRPLGLSACATAVLVTRPWRSLQGILDSSRIIGHLQAFRRLACIGMASFSPSFLSLPLSIWGLAECLPVLGKAHQSHGHKKRAFPSTICSLQQAVNLQSSSLVPPFPVSLLIIPVPLYALSLIQSCALLAHFTIITLYN